MRAERAYAQDDDSPAELDAVGSTIVVCSPRDAFGSGLHRVRPNDLVVHCATVGELLRCVRERACDLIVVSGALFVSEPVIAAARLACSSAPVLAFVEGAPRSPSYDRRLGAWVTDVPHDAEAFYERVQLLLDEDGGDDSGELVIEARRESQVVTRTSTKDAQLTRALDEMWMAFQPIVSCEGRCVRAYEALLRTESNVYPTPLALLDDANRLDRLWDVSRTARARTAEALADLPADTLAFVNLHVSDLFDDQLVDDSCPLLPYASRVVFEVTEQASVHELHDLPQRVEILRQRGYRVAVDDLGAGYSALSVLAILEPEFVKVDMSIVRDIHESKTKQRVLRSLLHLAGELGSTVICEGVETRNELAALLLLGCDWLQGYLFAKPSRGFCEVDVAGVLR